MRLIDADKLPVVHGLFTPVGGHINLNYDAVLLEDIEAAATVDVVIDLAAAKPTTSIISRQPRVVHYCGNCHRRLSPDDKYCRACGTRIAWA